MVDANHFADVRKMLSCSWPHEDDAHHFREVTQMVSAFRLAAVLPFCTLSAPVAHPNTERLTGAFLRERGAYEKRPSSRYRGNGRHHKT